jgi:serine/threonine protein kinase
MVLFIRHLPAATWLYDGRYQLESILGEGGFGITYRAYAVRLGRWVAIKEFFPAGAQRLGVNVISSGQVLPAEFAAMQQHFLDEAKILAQIDNRHVVKVYDVFQEHNTSYLVMEYLEGETLAMFLSKNRILLDEYTSKLALHLADALEALHQYNLLHRDIKPENVFLCQDGRAVLIDFGSARAFVRGNAIHNTRTLTPGYAAPEQYAQAAVFGPYTDIYSLGATLYHAVTGHMAPAATDRMLMPEQEIKPNSAIAQLNRAIIQSLTLAVAERPQNIADFRKLLIATLPIVHYESHGFLINETEISFNGVNNFLLSDIKDVDVRIKVISYTKTTFSTSESFGLAMQDMVNNDLIVVILLLCLPFFLYLTTVFGVIITAIMTLLYHILKLIASKKIKTSKPKAEFKNWSLHILYQGKWVKVCGYRDADWLTEVADQLKLAIGAV